LELLVCNGRSVPSATHSALKAWGDALGILWPLVAPIAKPEATYDNTAGITQARALLRFAIKGLEKLAADRKIPFMKRIFCAGLALMAHGCLRYADAQAIKNLEKSQSPIYGDTYVGKCDKDVVRNFAIPKTGFTNIQWYKPLFWISSTISQEE